MPRKEAGVEQKIEIKREEIGEIFLFYGIKVVNFFNNIFNFGKSNLIITNFT